MNARQSRPRGSNTNRPSLFARVDHKAKAKVDRVADALGISQSQALELILDHAEVDAHGRPSWYDGPLATDVQKELPLQRTA